MPSCAAQELHQVDADQSEGASGSLESGKSLSSESGELHEEDAITFSCVAPFSQLKALDKILKLGVFG